MTVLLFPGVGNWSWMAAAAVACPTCKCQPGDQCLSTGGGNRAVVATHKGRRDRVAEWSGDFANRAGWAARRYQRRDGERWPADAFNEFEAAAKPIVVSSVKPATPKGVRLSEKQAEEIEGYVLRGGYGTAPLAHFHGMAEHRQTTNALEAKGIIEQVGDGDGYDRPMRLTDFGWQVYHQHRLIIKRLTDEQVAEQVARAEQGRCIHCGAQPGVTDNCEGCDLARWIADDAARAGKAGAV